MAQYKATSTSSTTFRLTREGAEAGTLTYPKWYSFKAEINMADHSKYQLVPTGFWGTTIQLKQDDITLLDFKMGWKGIVINTNLEDSKEQYLLRLKGLLSSKYVLADSDGKELIEVDFNFKWKKLNYDYTIFTSDEFESFRRKELLLLTTLHCINYYLTVVSGT